MQIFSARKFALRTPRFDSETGKRRGLRYSWRALAAGLALALLAGSGIAVAAVASTADAHTPDITFNCQGIHVKASSYSGSDTNTIIVKIGTTTDFTTTFTSSFDQTFPFPNSTQAWDFHAEIKTTATNPAYQQSVDGPSTPCVAPTIDGAASACDTVQGTTALSALFGQLVVGNTYTVKLDGPNGNISTTPAYAPASATPPSYTEASWGSLAAGYTYTVTITDNANADLTKSFDIVSVGCPTTSGIVINPTECSVDGGSASLTVTASSLVAGRSYVVHVYKDGVDQPQPAFTATSTSYTSPAIGATPGSSYYVTITDVKADITSPQSSPTKFLPCPKTPTLLVNDTQCTTTDGTPNSSISFGATNLVVGRQYRVTVSDGSAILPYDTGSFVASSSNWPTATPTQVVPATPGKTYTVTVTDVLLTTFAASMPKVMMDCPKLPELTLTPTQCTVPGGTGSLATSVSATSYIPNRTYYIGLTLVQGGGTVVAPTAVVAPASGVWTLPAFPNLPPSAQYRVTLTDSVVTSVSAYGDISLADCPGMPSISVQASCNIIGASTVNVALDKLVAGQTYTVNIVNASTNKNVGTATVPGTNPTAALQLTNIRNGASYVVSVANANNTLTGSANIFLKVCDLPTLAFTGANPVGPAVAGIGFLQLGLVLVGISLAVRRRRTA